MTKKAYSEPKEFDIVTVIRGYRKDKNGLILRMWSEGKPYWAVKFENGVSVPLVLDDVKYHGRLDLGGF